MKKIIAGALLLALSFSVSAQVKVSGDRVSVNTDGMSLVLNARQGQALRFVYFGAKLSDADPRPSSSRARAR